MYRINKAKVPFLFSYSENKKLQNFIIPKLSINSNDKGIDKDLYRDKKKSLKIKTYRCYICDH